MTSLPDAWDQTTPLNLGTSLDLSFLLDMEGPCCLAEHVDDWGMGHLCIRIGGHTGRHLALHGNHGYVMAVWR